MPAELYTQVEINGQPYSIRKFDAKTGLKIARMVIAKAAPLIPLLEKAADGQEGKEKESSGMYEMVGAVLDKLSDADLDMLVDKCLRVCYANLPAGQQPIMDDMGHYGVEDVEYDLGLTLSLCFEAIKWGASDFFDGKSSLSTLFRR